MFGLASHWLTSSVSNLCKWVEVTGNEPALPSLGFNHALKATQTIRINKKISVRGGGHFGKGDGDVGVVMVVVVMVVVMVVVWNVGDGDDDLGSTWACAFPVPWDN